MHDSASNATAYSSNPCSSDTKKIFIFCDGTGNKFEGKIGSKDSNSNVVKLYTALEVGKTQLAYYHPGVGTLGDPSTSNSLIRFWKKVKGLAFGFGFRDNVLDAYRYLMENYEDGTEIYIFGFSRGSYTARALGGMLHRYGLLCPGNEGHMIYAWEMFQKEVKKQRKKLWDSGRKRKGTNAHTIDVDQKFLETFSRRVSIRFMGVFDTVSTIGWIYTSTRLLSMAQNPIIEVGRHVVSIDERRACFRDNLWGAPDSIDPTDWCEIVRGESSPTTPLKQDLAQVWFPGVHSDVGGSYPQNECGPSLQSLKWMMEELENNCADLNQERVKIVLSDPMADPADLLTALYPAPINLNYCLHKSLNWKWLILQFIPQQYYDKDDARIQLRVPYFTPRTIPDASVIHQSAVDRINHDPVYQKYNVGNLDARKLGTLPSPSRWTAANLTGCELYTNPPLPSNIWKTIKRRARLVLGVVTLIALAAIVLTIVWMVCAAIVWFVTYIVAHPRCVICWLYQLTKELIHFVYDWRP